MSNYKMDGVRTWSFYDGTNTLSRDKTDFIVEYEAKFNSAAGTNQEIRLKTVWEHVDFAVAKGLARRQWIEARLKLFRWTWIGVRGTLTIDGSLTHTDVILLDVQTDFNESNELFEYTLVFGKSVAGQVARSIVFTNTDGGASYTISSTNAYVHYSDQGDRTVFKELFRAAHVRVKQGPDLKSVTVEGIQVSTSGASALAKRKDAESKIKVLVDLKGQAGSLVIDSVNYGTCHLQDVQIQDLQQYDFVIYSLVYITGYVD